MNFLFALACSRSDGPATDADADADTDTDTDTDADADADADTDAPTSGDTGGTTSSTAETGGPPALGACDAFAACGGVPTGRWTLLEVCDATLPSPFASCPKAVGTRTLSGTGSIELQGSGSYARDQDLTEMTSYAFPASCNPTTCADLQASLGAAYEDYELTACADDGAGGCTCANPVHVVESDEQGEYVVAGTVLRFEPGDWIGTPLPDAVDFCAVPGTSLDLLVGEHVYRYVP